MAPSTHANPLRSNPPAEFASAPCLTPDRSKFSHASSSEGRITSPVMMIPGYEPITTTLTPAQLEEVLPTLHIYIDPALPMVALLPDSSVSHNGLRNALHWKEADDPQHAGMSNNLVEFIEIYQTLSFLGNRSDSPMLLPLGEAIYAEFSQGLYSYEVKDIWAMRYLPFTERFIDAMLKQLVIENESYSNEEEETAYHGVLGADKELKGLMAETFGIFEFVYGDEELLDRFKNMEARMQAQEKAKKRSRRMAQVIGDSLTSRRPRSCSCRGAIRSFTLDLQTVRER